MLLKASIAYTISLHRIEKHEHVIENTPPVPNAEHGALADEPSNDCCETSAITKQDDPSKSNSHVPYIVVPIVKNTLTSTSLTLPTSVRTIRDESSIWQYGMSLKMALPTAMPVGDSGVTIVFSFLSLPSKIGSRLRGKKKYAVIETDDYFNWAFENFSGYIAADEVYDGSFCILSLVDNRTYKRLMYRVLPHDPTSEDILALLQAFRQILERRELTFYGITTDASALYTKPVRTVFPGVRHQICEFHVKKEMNKAVLKPEGKNGRLCPLELPNFSCSTTF